MAFLVAVPQFPREPGSFCTASDPTFKEYRYAEHIPYCERDVSSETKAQVYDDYGIPVSERYNYTIDHIIPLALGGSNHRDNLWPEAKAIKKCRPKLETHLYVQMRDGAISQRDAVDIIRRVKYHDICQ